MLVLTRKQYETILVTTASGEQIEISISEIDRDRVKIGITADRETVQIVRGELQKK